MHNHGRVSVDVEGKRTMKDHHHCRNCGDMIDRSINFCGPCSRKKEEEQRLRDLLQPRNPILYLSNVGDKEIK